MYLDCLHLGKGGLLLFKGNLLGNIRGKATTIHLFPCQDEKEGVQQISQKELAACMRQKRTSWDAGAWKVQVANLIDVAWQKANAYMNNGSCLG